MAVLSPLPLGCRGDVAEDKKPPPTAEKQPAPPDRPKLRDGFYGVLRKGPRPEEVRPAAGETVVVNDHRYASDKDKPPAEYLAVRRAPDIPLVLASAPDAVKDDAGSTRIYLQLAGEYAVALEQFTRKNIGSSVAVIIGGEVVTVHKIRDAIAGGKVQITCCAEGSCEYLLKQLREKVQQGSGRKEAK